ncbi:hypothetical protein Q5P01_000119 [Channa striata]|uniref:Uncharacterized protein n=1 Tax=Channa striata TaxID=64152 RepID=A0AA88LM05_CHASR|nr:hypothetical protein Q5P01_000119 [Channa striata]
MGHVTEWFPCGHSAFRIESGVRGAPRLLVSCRAGRGESTREDFGGGRSDSGVPTLHVHRSPEYHAEAVPEGLRTNKHIFDRSACLLPGTMDVIAPPELSLAACVAVMYAFEVFSSLAGVDNRRETLAGLSFTGNLGPREARALVLTYLQLEERSARRLEKSVVRFEARSSSILSELRALVASRPEENLERQPPAADGGVCEGSGCPRGEGDVDGEPYLDGFSEPPGAVSNSRRTTGHVVLFGFGAGLRSSFRWITVGIRTLGLVNLKILRACGVFHAKHGRHRAMLKIPATRGVRPQPRGRGGPRARLADDLCFGEADEPWPCAAPAPLSDRGDCYFQLNYSRGSGRIAGGSGDDAREGLLSIEAMTGLERAVRSEDARGYEEPRLARIFRHLQAPGLGRSRDAILVRSSGNLVLHADPGGLRVSAIRGEPGLHALIETPRENDRAGKRSQASSGKPETLHLRCERSLREFCELRGLPEGIRGPETWSRPTPWSRRDPGSFCAEVAELRFRWESGRTEPSSSAPSRHGRGPAANEDPPRWKRSADGGLIPERQRFWDRIDSEASFLRRNEAEAPSAGGSGDGRPPGEDEGEPFAPVKVKSEWREEGVSCFLSLNDRLEIEMLPELPEIGGHVFFEPVHNADWKVPSTLDEDGKLLRYYKPHRFRSLACHVCTVLAFGCGLRPVFVHGSSDAAGDRVLDAVLVATALSERLSADAYPGPFGIALVVRGGREEMLKRARELCRTVLVTNGRTTTGASAYALEGLPERLDGELARGPRPLSTSPRGCLYASPERFLAESGALAFAQLTTLWPSASQRADVKHPACSGDPRWIGLMLCLAEWQGSPSVSDSVALGALEALLLRDPSRGD